LVVKIKNKTIAKYSAAKCHGLALLVFKFALPFMEEQKFSSL